MMFGLTDAHTRQSAQMCQFRTDSYVILLKIKEFGNTDISNSSQTFSIPSLLTQSDLEIIKTGITAILYVISLPTVGDTV